MPVSLRQRDLGLIFQVVIRTAFKELIYEKT